MIYIGSDHVGLKLKEVVLDYLQMRGYKVKDLGTDNDSVVDYPEIAKLVAEKVVGEFNSRGILISDTGQGMCIAANKFKKISAVLVFNEEMAEKARLEDNSNVLCLPSGYIGAEPVKEIVGVWLSTSFSAVDYYVKCVKQIREMEKNA